MSAHPETIQICLPDGDSAGIGLAVFTSPIGQFLEVLLVLPSVSPSNS